MDIKSLLSQNITYSEIQKITGLAKATISYHAKKLGMPRQKHKQYDWNSIEKDIQFGNSMRFVKKKHNISWETLKNAIKDNKISPFINRKLVVHEVLVENSKNSRSSAKRLIIKNKLLEYSCKICGIGPIWNNKKLVLVIDHINGVNNDHRIENLRFLCPNCNSQTDTFTGKNTKKTKNNYCSVV